MVVVVTVRENQTEVWPLGYISRGLGLHARLG